MRELIEPALEIFARTGLFLSVVAWIVSLWWAISASGSWPGGEFGGSLFHCGWAGMVTVPIGIPKRIDHGITERDDMHADNFNSSVLLGREGSGMFIAIRHWLVVTIFATFYAVLKWVYRKRRTEPTSLSSSHSDEPMNEAHET